jgi:hypothetical protein
MLSIAAAARSCRVGMADLRVVNSPDRTCGGQGPRSWGEVQNKMSDITRDGYGPRSHPACMFILDARACRIQGAAAPQPPPWVPRHDSTPITNHDHCSRVTISRRYSKTSSCIVLSTEQMIHHCNVFDSLFYNTQHILREAERTLRIA